MRKYIVLGLVGLSLLIFAACGTAAPPASGPTATPSTQTGPTPSSSSPSEETQLVTRGQSFRFQYACINRTLAPCGLMQDFAESVRERTEGQVDIQISSFPELGLTGADTLRLIRDGTLNMVELYPGYVGGDWPFIEMGELLGLFPDAETQLEVALSLREDEARLLRERFNAQPIAYHFYDSQFFFSKQPLNSQADFSGKKIRQHSVPLGDLVAHLGGEGQFVAFAEVYTALERGVIDAALTGVLPGHGQKWYEVSRYLVGPIPARPHNTVLMNLDSWNRLPQDIQEIILEEGRKYSDNALQKVVEWEQEGIEQNVAEGMEHLEFSPEMNEVIRQAAIESILPNWIQRAGGPNSEAAQVFNAKVGPILGLVVNPDGTIGETEVVRSTPQTETQLVTQGQNFRFQLTCVNRTLKPCDMLAEYARQIRERTEGQVDIQITSYPELGLSGPDTLRLLRDGTIPFVEMYPGYVGGEWPFVEMAELIGMFPDEETQKRVIAVLMDDEARIIEERFNGKVVARHMYDNQFIFSKRAIRTPEDFRGLRVRTHSTASGDFTNALGGEGQFIAFAEAYTAMERGILEAAMASGTAGVGQKWYEVTRYLVGPIVSRPHNSVIMNLDQWNRLPEDIQQIILEEGRKHTEENARLVQEWDRESIEDSVAQGMEYIEFSPEMQETIRQAVISHILPNWVQRAGGPNSEAVQTFNQKVAPIVGIEVLPDGSAREIPAVQ